MYPQDALDLLTGIKELFPAISRTDCELLQHSLEKYHLSITEAEAVIRNYAKETTTYDRAKLFRLLHEEHARRTQSSSPTRQWQEAKKVEKRIIAEELGKLPKRQIDRLLNAVNKKYPDLIRLLKNNPLETDIGRSIVFQELKSQQAC